MTENGLFVLGGPEADLHDILWAVHDVKNHGRSEGEKFSGISRYTIGGWSGASDAWWFAHFSRTRTCASRITEPEREPFALLNPSDPIPRTY